MMMRIPFYVPCDSGKANGTAFQNGQDILDSLSQLKPILVERYENWQSNQRSSPESSRPTSADPHLTREEERAREAREAARREEAWKQEEYLRRQAEERERQAREEAAWRQSQDRSGLTERQRRDEENRRYALEEAKREEERAKRRAADDKRRQEQDGILRRQHESEAASRAARRDMSRLTPSPVPPSASSGSVRMPEPDHGSRHSGRSVYAPQPSHPTDQFVGTSTLMPLENPNKYDDDSSTDVEGSKMSWRAQRNAEQTPKAKPPG